MNNYRWPDMVRGFTSFSSQCPAQYPRQKGQQKIDGPDEKIPTLPVRVLLFAKVA
jgi:hypothetical protein